jgi:hypothetical protein
MSKTNRTSRLDALLGPRDTTIDSIHARVRAAYPEAYYEGGIGWCGPNFMEAQALYDELRRLDSPSTVGPR